MCAGADVRYLTSGSPWLSLELHTRYHGLDLQQVVHMCVIMGIELLTTQRNHE